MDCVTTTTPPARRDASRPITLVELPDLIGPDGAIDEHALAQLEAEGAGTSTTSAPVPSSPKPAAREGLGQGLALGGVVAVVAAVDRILAEHGETLRSLSQAGPLSGALLQNWWIVLGAYLLARAAGRRWRDWITASRARDARAGAQARAQLRALALVARESERTTESVQRVSAQIEALRGEVAAVSMLAQATDERQRRESDDLRRHVDHIAGEFERRLRAVEPARSGA